MIKNVVIIHETDVEFRIQVFTLKPFPGGLL